MPTAEKVNKLFVFVDGSVLCAQRVPSSMQDSPDAIPARTWQIIIPCEDVAVSVIDRPHSEQNFYLVISALSSAFRSLFWRDARFVVSRVGS